MEFVQAAAIYMLIWTWVLVFVRLWSQAHQPENSGPVPKLLRAMLIIPRSTLLWTTAIASLLFGLYYFLKIYSPITLEDFLVALGKRVITPAAIYFILWWVMLFAVLPWGVHSQEETGNIVPGSDPGAPAVPNLKAKLFWTTVVTTVVFALLYVVYVYRLVALDDLAAALGMPR